MNIRVLGFGIVKEIFNAPSIHLDIPEDAKTAYLIDELKIRYPRLQKLNSLLVAVNNSYATNDQLLRSDDEIAIIPPVSGG